MHVHGGGESFTDPVERLGWIPAERVEKDDDRNIVLRRKERVDVLKWDTFGPSPSTSESGSTIVPRVKVDDDLAKTTSDVHGEAGGAHFETRVFE